MTSAKSVLVVISSRKEDALVSWEASLKSKACWNHVTLLTKLVQCSTPIPVTLASLTNHLEKIASKSHCPSGQFLHPSRFLSPSSPLTLQMFVCQLCEEVLDRPIELHCQHMFCSQCLVKQVARSHHSACPTCDQTISDLQHIKCPSEIIQASLELRCGQGQCPRYVLLQDLCSHSKSCQGTKRRSNHLSSNEPTQNIFWQIS